MQNTGQCKVMTAADRNQRTKKRWLTGAVIVATAICLRAPITSVGSVLYCIRSDLNLSGMVAGIITTIPLLVFVIWSPFISKVAGRIGIGRALRIGMSMIFAGVLFRSFGGFAGLLGGTALIGAGIAFGNVLIPAMIKNSFADKIGLMTGVFTVTMSVSSGIGAGISVPLAVKMGLGWQVTFCIWAVAAVIAITMNLLHFGNRSETFAGQQLQKREKAMPLYKNSLAWSLMLLFGGQSCVFYTLVSWLPTIAADKGISAVAAGMLATMFQIGAIPANMGIPLLADRMKNQRALAISVPAVGVIALLLIMVSSSFWLMAVATVMLALSLGGTFSLTLVFFGMRAATAENSARLSGFAQSGGYLMAAIGPAFAGLLYDTTHSWNLPLLASIGAMAVSAAAGNIAGSDRKL